MTPIHSSFDKAQHQLDQALMTLSQLKKVDLGTSPKTLIWQEGKVKLYRYQSKPKGRVKTPLLIVYALVNRPTILDIEPKRSLIQGLLKQGIDVYSIDWGYPTRIDRYKTLEDLIQEMRDVIQLIKRKSKQEAINMLGVCQGGVFSLIYSALYAKDIKNLITMVTPVDFQTKYGLLYQWAHDFDVDELVERYNGLVPSSYLNLGFDQIKPMNKFRKYLVLPQVMQNSDRLMSFLRMEYWVSDSPAQPGEIFKTFVKELYQKNALMTGKLQVGRRKVKLKYIKMPLLNIYGKYDHIIPQASTTILNKQVGTKDHELMGFDAGHIGVFVSSKTQQQIAPAIGNWLQKRE